MHELILFAGERGRVGTGEDADGIHHITLILQSFRCGDRAVCHRSIEIGHRRRRTIRKENDDLLRIGPSIFHYLDRAFESIVGPGGTSSFKLVDLGFQATHIRSQLAYDLGIVVLVSTTSVHVIPDFVRFIAGELHQSNANQFGTGLRISIRGFIKKCFNRFFQCV